MKLILKQQIRIDYPRPLFILIKCSSFKLSSVIGLRSVCGGLIEAKRGEANIGAGMYSDIGLRGNDPDMFFNIKRF